MQIVAHNEIDHANAGDVGKTALMYVGGSHVLAIEDTLNKCLRVWNDINRSENSPLTADDVDDHTALKYLTTADLVAVEVGPETGECCWLPLGNLLFVTVASPSRRCSPGMAAQTVCSRAQTV